MFDIGFPELLLVSVIALLVIGPEKLPQTIKTLSLWLGRFKASLSSIKSEIEAEIGADEIRQQIHNESILKELKESKQHLEGIVDDTKNTLKNLTEPTRDLTDLSAEEKLDGQLGGPTNRG
jgi:sec-independent protein translocase protein TatB